MANFVTIVSGLIVFISVAIPIFLSEVIGGWTKKYTSPVSFRPTQIPNLSERVTIVTGSNTGIGYVTALELARHGATVIVASRSKDKGTKAVEKIQKEVKDAKVQFLQLDLASLASVEAFSKSFLELKLPLHTLILNAGVMKSPGAEFVGEAMTYGFETTKDGFEYHIGVNHIAHAYLVKLLLPSLKDSAPSRVVSVSSMAEQGAPESGMKFSDWWVPKDGSMPEDYEDGQAYGQSKLANLMYARELSRRLSKTNVSVYSLHPGVIISDLSRYMEPVMEENAQAKGKVFAFIAKILGNLFYLSNFDTEGGALTQLHLSTAEPSTLENGGFYHPIGKLVNPTHPQGLNETLATILWEQTDRAIIERSSYKY